MSRSIAHDAITLLINLAQQGEIDPWNVQVVEVLDRFLNELTFQDSQELAPSGQAFLYASMLVLFKAETLVANEEEQDEGVEQLFLEDAPLMSDGLPSPLENCLQRRSAAVPPSQRRVTLPELIQQLELMAEMAERQSNRPRVRKVRRTPRSQAAKAIAQLAHQENLSEVAEEIEVILSGVGSDPGWLDIEYLLQFKDDPVGVFWALLLLCSQSKVELEQSEFYRDLRLRPLCPDRFTVSDIHPELNSAAS